MDKGFIADNGVILGQKHDAKIFKKRGDWVQKKTSPLIIDGDDTASIVAAPSRSGKGISCIIPTLLSWLGSVIVFDPKGENWDATAGFRQKFSHAVRFSPVNKFSISFNPLAEIRKDENAYRDASTIADILLTKDSKGGGENDHFTDTAKDLLTGAILHVVSCLDFDDEDRNLKTVLDVLSGSNLTGIEEDDEISEIILNTIIHSKHSNEDLHNQVVNIATRALSKPDRERGSVFSTATRVLMLFEDPILARNMSKSDLKFSDFFEAKNPISLYLTVPFADIQRLAPIIKLLVTFMIRRFSEGETSHDKKALKNKCLFLIDEFPTLGAFPFLKTTMGILAGYGVKFLLVVQSLTQIIELYGREHPFLEHCKKWLVFAPGDITTAEQLSKVAGTYSKWQESVSSSGSKYDVGMKQMSRSGSEQQVKLIHPDQIMRMKDGECLIFAHGMNPYRAKKVLFFKDKRFKNLVKIPAPQTMEELYSELHGLPRDTQKTANDDGFQKTTKDSDGFFEGIENGGGIPPKIEDESTYEDASAPNNTPEQPGSEFALTPVVAEPLQQQNQPDTEADSYSSDNQKKTWWGAL